MPKHSFKCCLFSERIFEHEVATPPEEVQKLFNEYSKNGTMGVENLLKFMIEYQKEKNATKDDAQKIFDSLKQLNVNEHGGGLDLNAFLRYLLSDLNPPLPVKAHVHQDMDAPLSHYFLYTGHNSYLTGNQFASRSCVKPIINALERGVRVIELDLWPKRLKKGVKVCHGGTLTSRVELKKCLLAIEEHAFRASEYPVIITFEDHLTPDLQDQVAKMLNEIFGKKGMLYYPQKSDNLEEFGSPNSLKRKVLISTKPPEKCGKAKDMKREVSWQNLKSSSGKEAADIEKTYSKSESDITDKDELEDGELSEKEDEEKAGPEYRDLIAIHQIKLKGGLSKVLGVDQSKARRLSMSEQWLEKTVKAHGADIVRFTQKNLLRVYPKSTRIDSSNYNPYFGWEHGAQMVAFNMQGTGKYLWIMQGMFRANGGCGYVKKPEFLLRDGQNNNFFRPSQQLKIRKTLKVKIFHGDGWYSDFHLTAFDKYSPPDFFVKIGIAGVPADADHSGETKKVMDQWIPVWNKEFTFRLTIPELAVLCIEVFDYDKGRNDFAGQTCLPVSELRSGIRAVPLHNKKGDQYKNTRLLMHFQFL